MLGLPRTILRTAWKTGSGAAQLGAWGAGKAAARLRRSDESHDVAVEHRGEPTVVTPSKPRPAPKRQPRKASAPAKTAGRKADAAPAGPVPRRISNPKAAKAVRKRTAKASGTSRLEVPGDTARGGHPITHAAENTPSERAQAKAGKEPAPMGSSQADQPKSGT